MKTTKKIFKLNVNILSTITIFLCMLFSITALLMFIPAVSQGKTSKTAFADKYNTVYVGKTYKYNIVNPPQNSKIKFIVTNKKIATINSSSGILYPRRKGNVTIKAFITGVNKKQKITLKKAVRVKAVSKQNKTTDTPFSLPSSYVNSINYTVKLKSSKIMQTSEVKTSYIHLSKDNYALKGQFKNLSDDGRYITYELNDEAVKQLTPGDKTMDGTYTMSCSLSSHKLNINYAEHLVGQSVTGFIMTSDGKPVNNAKVTLSNNDFTVYTISDKNGYYNIRFPKPETVSLTVSNDKYYTSVTKNIYLKISKAVCKNIIVHKISEADKNAVSPSAYFNISSAGNTPAGIEISSCVSDNEPSDGNSEFFTTDMFGRIFITSDTAQATSSTLNSNTDTIQATSNTLAADTVNISADKKYISHNENIDMTNVKNGIYPFSYQKKYYVRIFSDNENKHLPDYEFYFSFDDFTSNSIAFNIALTQPEKTTFSSDLLPLKTGSNISSDKINYYHADLYRIGISSPISSFNFCENTPVNFKYRIDISNLYLRPENSYYAIFNIIGYDNEKSLSEILAPFKIINNKMVFDDLSLTFSEENSPDIKRQELTPLSDIILNIGQLQHDNNYKNTVLCIYDSYGQIKETLFTSLSSPELQKKLSHGASGYIIYTDLALFDI